MRILIDTNVLVRSIERAHPLMRIARDALRNLYEQNDELCIAPQIVSEFWNVCTRPQQSNGLGNGIGPTDRLVQRIETLFTMLPDSSEAYRVWRELVVLHRVRGAKVHDARLVAVAKANGVEAILTFNTADFQRYTRLRTLDPAVLP